MSSEVDVAGPPTSSAADCDYVRPAVVEYFYVWTSVVACDYVRTMLSD